MLTEGQRKANFEEYEAKKHEYAEKITTLKQSIKELYVEYANTQNVIMKFDDRSWKSRMKIAIFEISPGVKILFVPLFQNQGKSEARRVRTGRQSSAYGKKRNLDETIARVQEDNVRLRKKHDLIKYQRNKVRYRSLSRRKKKKRKKLFRASV